MYEIQQLFGGTWENCLQYNDETPIVLDTIEDAQAELKFHFDNLQHAVDDGYIDDYNPEDFRIIGVK